MDEIKIEIDDNALNIDLKEEVFNISIDGAVGGDFSPKIHSHTTQEINGLNIILQQLIDKIKPTIKINGGYFAD